jgi:hypothetical protein
LERGDRAQVIVARRRGQRAGIDLAHFEQHGIRRIFRGERAETEAITQAMVLGALYEIEIFGCECSRHLRRYIDRRSRRTEIDHEGAGAAEARHFRHWFDQFLDAEIP